MRVIPLPDAEVDVTPVADTLGQRAAAVTDKDQFLAQSDPDPRVREEAARGLRFGGGGRKTLAGGVTKKLKKETENLMVFTAPCARIVWQQTRFITDSLCI